MFDLTNTDNIQSLLSLLFFFWKLRIFFQQNNLSKAIMIKKKLTPANLSLTICVYFSILNVGD